MKSLHQGEASQQPVRRALSRPDVHWTLDRNGLMWNIFQDILEFQKSISKSYLDHSWPWPVPVEWFVLLPKGHFLTLHICAQWLEALRLRAKHTTHDTQSSSCASCNEPREMLIVAPPFPGHCRRSQPH